MVTMASVALHACTREAPQREQSRTRTAERCPNEGRDNTNTMTKWRAVDVNWAYNCVQMAGRLHKPHRLRKR